MKSAEFWLELGQPGEALKELKTLSQRARKHPWASQVVLTARQTYCALTSGCTRF